MIMADLAWIVNDIPNLLHEDFETGANNPPGSQWTNDTLSTDVQWNFTPALLGNFSAVAPLVAANTGGLNYTFLSDINEIYVFFYFKSSALVQNPSRMFAIFNNLGGSFPNNEMLRLVVNTTGTVAISCKGGVGTTTTTGTITAATLYYFWIHFKFVTATTSIATVEFSTTRQRTGTGNNFASITTGTANFGARQLTFGPGGVAGNQQVYDHIGVSSGSAMDTGWGGF